MSENIIPHDYKVTRDDREKAQGNKAIFVLLTGLSGSGKSTIANALEQYLFENGLRTYVLDGDNVRKGINNNLSFSPEDRSENIRRIGELGKLFVDAGLITLAAFIAPYRADREAMRDLVGAERYCEVFVNTSLEVCEARDVKGLYAKARAGEIKNMTGVSAPYEAPEHPSVEVTHEQSIEESVAAIYNVLLQQIKLNNE